MSRIHPDGCPVQKPYDLFRAIMKLASDDCVAAMRQHIGQLATRRLENVCSEELVHRQRARDDADIKASAERATGGR